MRAQSILRQALVIPLTVVGRDALRNRPPEMTFAERDHAIETLVLDRAHERLMSACRGAFGPIFGDRSDQSLLPHLGGRRRDDVAVSGARSGEPRHGDRCWQRWNT